MARFIAKTLPFLVGVVLTLVAISTIASAQSGQFGIPSFSSIAGGPEAINVGNLGFVYTIPVYSRGGRGGPLTITQNLQSDSWTQAYNSNVPSQLQWYPSFAPGGISGGTGLNNGIGYVGAPRTTETCANEMGDPTHLLTFYYYTFYYVDGAGISHPFPLTLSTLSSELYLCADYIHKLSGTATAEDGSGISINANVDDGPQAEITLRDGTVISGAMAGATQATSIDSNGNTKTFNQAWNDNTSGLTSFSVEDTLGTTAISGNGNTYSYTPPSGAAANFTATTTEFTVQTKFNCPGVVEFPATPYSLVTGFTLPDGSTYHITYEPTTSGSSNVTGRIASVTLPTGGIISYTYTGGDSGTGIFCTDGSTAGFNRTTPDGTWHYLRSNYASTGSCGGIFYETCIWSSATTVTDPLGNTTVMKFDVGYEVQRQVYTGAATGTPLQTVITCYNGNTSNCGTQTAQDINGVTELNAYTSFNGGAQSRVDTFYNSYGLVTMKNEYDFGGTTPLRETTITYDSTLGNGVVDKPDQVTVSNGSGNFVSQTTYVYDQDEAADTLVASGATQLTAVSCTVSSGKCRGNLTTENMYVTPTTYLTKTFNHYDSGAVYQATDVNGAVTSYTYGNCGNSFLTGVSLPLSLSESYTWNCTGGMKLTSTDENTNVSSATYTDPYFWRPYSSTDQDKFTTTYAYTPTSVESVLLFNSNLSTVDGLTTVDSLGRAHVTQKRQAPGSSNFDSGEVDYAPLGRVARQTMPYAAAAGVTNSTAPSTTTQYDGLGRAVTVTDAGTGTVSYTYVQNDALQSVGPTQYFQKQLEYDGLGRLTSVCEVTTVSGSGTCGQSNQTQGYWTRYLYDALGHLIGVCQNTTVPLSTNCVTSPSAAQQTRTYTYDGLGRLTSEMNPESGTTTYTYDSDPGGDSCASGARTSVGDMLKTIDANGNFVCYIYDALHRVTDVGNALQGYSYSPCKRFRYDKASNGVQTQPPGSTLSNLAGRLVEVETDSGSRITDEWFSYDADGHMIGMWEETPHSVGFFYAAATIAGNGAITSLDLTNASLTGTYGLDGEGRGKSLSVNSTTMVSGVTGVTYNVASQPMTIPVGSGTDNDTYTYDPNTGRMETWDFTVNSVSEKGTLNWNPNWTLGSLAIADGFNSGGTQLCSFNASLVAGTGYDNLGRLIGVSCAPSGGTAGSTWNQTYSYDPYGNLTKSSSSFVSWNPGYGSTNRYTCSGCTYDLSGDVTNDGTNTYTWNGYNKLASVNSSACGTNGECLTYDALGREVEASNGSTWMTAWYTPMGKTEFVNESASVVDHTFWPAPGGGSILQIGTGAAWYYQHRDWLGSARISSTIPATGNGSVYTDRALAPFGEVYDIFGSTSQDETNFTGDTQDILAGMYDTPNRELQGSQQGRWLSPDPAGLKAADPSDPQSWNRYAYVGGNPLNRTDPSGLIYLAGHYFNLTANQITCASGSGPAICPPQSMANDEFGQLANGGCDEECRHEMIIKTGCDPYFKACGSVQYIVNGGDGSVLQQQKLVAAVQIGGNRCAGQDQASITNCIQQAFDTMTVAKNADGSDMLVGGNYNFLTDSVVINFQGITPVDLGCNTVGANTRCGVIDSLHFHVVNNLNVFHVDTGNAWAFPIGTFAHLGWDIVGGNTVWSAGGIPRPWY